MIHYQFVLLSFLSAFFIGCQTQENPKQQLPQDIAANIEQLLPEVSEQMETIQQIATSINVQGRTLTMDEIELVAQIEGLTQPWDAWQQNYTQFKSLLAENALNNNDKTTFLKKLYTQLQSLSDMANEITL
ncbi:MAG: hypothetical protein HC892_01810 [Saprospiraceae bacterium]|nr:hypothetical protein [Saprospiraceae bacterium]